MVDVVSVKDLVLRCVVGVHPGERRAKRKVLVQLRMETDLREASRTDDLSATVDYEAVTRRIAEAVESSSFLLIERLAGRIAETCLKEPRVAAVEVEVEKPGALSSSRTVSVRIRRARTRSGRRPAGRGA